jgi:hypothetical protein
MTPLEKVLLIWTLFCVADAAVSVYGRKYLEGLKRWLPGSGFWAAVKRYREPPKPLPAAGMFLSKTAAKEIEGVLPGEVLTITLSGRQFAIVEREEFDLILNRAGMAQKARS